jgi:hypothetical protein
MFEFLKWGDPDSENPSANPDQYTDPIGPKMPAVQVSAVPQIRGDSSPVPSPQINWANWLVGGGVIVMTAIALKIYWPVLFGKKRQGV